MLTPWNDGEAELLIVFGGLIEVANDYNNVIDPLKHEELRHLINRQATIKGRAFRSEGNRFIA
jgi:hypothetical protein